MRSVVGAVVDEIDESERVVGSSGARLDGDVVAELVAARWAHGVPVVIADSPTKSATSTSGRWCVYLSVMNGARPIWEVLKVVGGGVGPGEP
ncbi:hypothetical protein [Nocardia sp. NPDC051570]|uniref:hypothetical protein n=1 Tax=Nocardia sp. NPDC051570 TaxID=3364324 RepID=UPI0037BBC452